jgi:hypothetical protein
MAADGEDDRSVCAAELGGDLLAARAGADDEDAAPGERNGIPVPIGMNLEEVTRCRGGCRRIRGSAESPVATTTLHACHGPASVSMRKPARDCSTALTATCSMTGALTASA